MKRRGVCAVNGSSPAAKRPMIDEASDRVCSMNPAYSGDVVQEKLTSAWRNKETVSDGSTGAELFARPFQCCVLPNFVSPQSPITSEAGKKGQEVDFLKKLRDELLRLKLYEKNNDLYQFHQSDDLKKFSGQCISALKCVLREECLPWLRSVTGLELTDTIDVTCSKYEYTDVLLCHDDELEGRRIAFIFYLVPEWSEEDGGSLDLFNVDDNGQPLSIVKSLLPVWNNFVFFDVNAVSFHKVSEVTSPSKTRLSVNGWFHGPPPVRPLPYKEVVRPLHSPVPMELEILSDWINPIYLDIGVQGQIQAQFEEDSQIELPDFLLEDKYSQLGKELCASDSTVTGVPNKRRVHLVSFETLSCCGQLVDVLKSEPFCLLLSHLTGLDLAENIIRDANSANDPESSNGSLSHDTAGPSSSSQGSSQLAGGATVNSTQDGAQRASGGGEGVALCRCDVYSWQHGDYTLAGDEGDPGAGRFALDAHLYCCSEDWSPDFGGVATYIMKDADEELLSISPRPNALSLVYRDQDTLSFTKYINKRSHGGDWLNTVHATYSENPKL